MGMALTNNVGRIVRVNSALCDLTGRAAQELTGMRFDGLTHPLDADTDRHVVRALLSGERAQYKAETRFLHAGGAPVWVSLQATTITDDAGAPRRFLVQVQDVTHRRQYEENLQYLATHDPLTGLHNRSSFAAQLEAHADLVRRYGSDGALVLLDLDHFKYVNDTLGHAVGDQLIARVATILAGRLRGTDVLARLGGDEFAALLPRADAATATRVAADLLEALRAERIAVPGTGGRTMTASIGVALFEASEELRGEDVLVNADLAMYDAKEAGRNQLVRARRRRARAGADAGPHHVGRADPRRDRRGSFCARRPADLRSQDRGGDPVRGPAAHARRRRRPDRPGRVPRHGGAARHDPADRRDDGRAGAPCGRRARRHPRAAPRVEINLSGASMGDPEMLRTIERELDETGLDPSRVIFEITETAAIANIGRARLFSDQLAALGCQFALDDFGAGFGSFYYLKHVRFDILKIDGEFVRDCCTTPTDRLIIRSVVDIARGLGKQTIAEHVGDAATVALLRDLGVTHGQGFHLGAPRPLDGFLAELYGPPAAVA